MAYIYAYQCLPQANNSQILQYIYYNLLLLRQNLLNSMILTCSTFHYYFIILFILPPLKDINVNAAHLMVYSTMMSILFHNILPRKYSVSRKLCLKCYNF